MAKCCVYARRAAASASSSDAKIGSAASAEGRRRCGRRRGGRAADHDQREHPRHGNRARCAAGDAAGRANNRHGEYPRREHVVIPRVFHSESAESGVSAADHPDCRGPQAGARARHPRASGQPRRRRLSSARPSEMLTPMPGRHRYGGLLLQPREPVAARLERQQHDNSNGLGSVSTSRGYRPFRIGAEDLEPGARSLRRAQRTRLTRGGTALPAPGGAARPRRARPARRSRSRGSHP